MKPAENPLGVSPNKRNQGTTQGKENIVLTSVGINRAHYLRFRSTAAPPTALRSKTEKVVGD